MASTPKPVFLSKAERAQLALQRRHDQVAEQRLSKPISASSSKDPPRESRNRDRDAPSRDRHRDEPRESRDRDRERERGDASVKMEKREREKELEAIKDQYLGTKKPKKRVIKPSEKFRFSFEWENTEDTSRDMNSLYQNRSQVVVRPRVPCWTRKSSEQTMG